MHIYRESTGFALFISVPGGRGGGGGAGEAGRGGGCSPTQICSEIVNICLLVNNEYLNVQKY